MRKIDYFPLKVSLTFLVITELLFWIGPTVYHISNDWALAAYLLLMNLSLILGYKKGVARCCPSEFTFNNRIVAFLLIIGLIAVYRNMVNIWSNHGIAVTFTSLLNALTNPGEAYLSESDSSQYFGGFFDMTFLAIFRTIAIPLGIYKWHNLKGWLKCIVVLTIIIQIAAFLGVGIRKGLLDIIIYTIFIIIAKNKELITNPTKNRRVKICAIVILFLFIFYFLFSNASRYGFSLQEIGLLTASEPRKIYADNLPEWLVFSLQEITGYLCQGYYALAKALEMGVDRIVWFGDSWVSIYYSKKFFGYDPTPYTYMADLEAFGIDMKVNWHTMYLWLANQYTFIGVPFIVFFVGYFFAVCWKDSVNGKNDLSIIVLSFIVIMVFYMYANNQVFSDCATSFWFWFILYIVKKKKVVLSTMAQ